MITQMITPAYSGKAYCGSEIFIIDDRLSIERKMGNITFHSLRHYLNTSLVAEGVSGERIRQTTWAYN